MKVNKHIINKIEKKSIAADYGIEVGDAILEINNQTIEDIFDYRYLIQDEKIEIKLLSKQGKKETVTIEKEFGEDLGISFENGLMDDYRSCHNKCIFCFIDQMPPGMRETLYFKDDDSRLSFLQGNYITLTNLSDDDVNRIIKYRLEPMNISFQTMNPELRCKMLNNRFAGDALKKAYLLKENSITMNGQIVLCKGINDGQELEYSLTKMMELMPELESVSVVPVGLSRYREGLYPLEPFTKEDAVKVLNIIRHFQEIGMSKNNSHFVHASDEFYLLAEEEIPPASDYDGYLQLENGVGMIRLFKDEFEEAFIELQRKCSKNPLLRAKLNKRRKVSVATGKLAYPLISESAAAIEAVFPKIEIAVNPIRNDFFGESITVAGLLTGQDIFAQLRTQNLGSCLYLPECVLRANEEVFLDDMTLHELETSLQVHVDIVKSSGQDFLKSMLGI